MMKQNATKQTQSTKRTATVATVATVALSAVSLLLTGCVAGMAGSGSTGSTLSPAAALGIHGSVHGGQPPIGYSKVQLYQIATGSSATAALPLGPSVITDANGNFSITGNYSCTQYTPANAMVYIVATGGNSGFSGGNTVNNSAISLMAGLGSCANLVANAATTFVSINEVTTVATAYALSGYMSGYANAGYPSALPNALAGLTSAFATQNVLVYLGYGTANPTVAGSGIALPNTKINSLANLMSACINTSSSSSPACTAIFGATAVSGNTPADTIGSILNVVHNPSLNLSSVYTTYAPSLGAPFGPYLSSAPSDWTLPIVYTGNGLSVPYSVAFDASGNAWIANESGNAVTEISNSIFASGTTGFASASIVGPQAIAIDLTGNVWLANTGANNLLELSSAGAVTNTVTSGISGPVSLTIDTNNVVWVSNFDNNTIAAFTNGSPYGGSPFTNAALVGPTGITIDGSNNLLVSNSVPGGIAVFNNSGVFQNTYTDGLSIAPGGIAVDIANTKKSYTASTGISAIDSFSSFFSPTATPLSGGGVNIPYAVAVDNAGTVWTANGTAAAAVSAFSSTGTSLFTSGVGSLNQPVGIAIDGSGNLWTTDAGDNSVTQFVGLSVPTITPVAAAFLYY